MDKQSTLKLTGKQARYLRGLGHKFKPVVMIGKQELSADVIAAVNDALETHELIKVKLQEGCLTNRRTIAEQLAELTNSAVAQVLGKTILLYRPSDEKLLTLPSSSV